MTHARPSTRKFRFPEAPGLWRGAGQGPSRGSRHSSGEAQDWAAPDEGFSDPGSRQGPGAFGRPDLVVGVGFRRGTGAEEIAALIRRAIEEAGGGAPVAIAVPADRAGEPALRAAAAAFGLVPAGVAPEALAAADAGVLTRSPRVEALRGVGSVAEAAALACAGPGARLALTRIASAGATCALARPAALDPLP